MKKILLAAFIVGTLFSCSSDDNSGESNKVGNDSSVLPVKIIETSSDGQYKFIADFFYEGNKIKEINKSYHDREDYSEKVVYQYTGDFITKVTTYGDDGEIIIEEYTYQNGKVSTLTTTESGGKTISKLEWIDDNHLIETVTADGDSTYSDEYFYENGNMVKEVYNNSENVNSNIYDDKENPFKNITGYKLISYGEDAYSENNIIRSNSSSQGNLSSTSYTYVYKENNYPSKSVRVYDNTVEKDFTTEYYYNK